MNSKEYNDMFEILKSYGDKAFTMSHYDFAKKTDIKDISLWREFLLDPQTVDWINNEMNLIRAAQINKIQMNAADSNSVGQAQLLNALATQAERNHHKDGPAFIYCHVPLSSTQKKSPAAKLIEQYTKGEL
jgi:hypothetical protein